MSLLAKVKSKDPKGGFCPDFVTMHMQPNLEHIKKKGIKIISNAGGINPSACADALQAAAKAKGMADGLNIAVIEGDDLSQMKEKFTKDGVTEMDSGAPFPKKLASMNAYLGAEPIKIALDAGADIVLTGRCVDSALALGPLMHKYSWTSSDYEKLSLGSLAGHLIECGAQSTGGIFTDWKSVEGWDNIGFPIVEFSKDQQKSFTLTKPAATGGLVSFGTVAEQLTYEIGDPANYLLPDVAADFSNVTIEESGENAVTVTNCAGKQPSGKYKVSATYADGYRCTTVCPVIGPDASEKAIKTANAIINRCQRIFKMLKMEDFKSTTVSVIGSEKLYAGRENIQNPNEAALWLSVEHSQRQALELFAREIAPAGTGMAPGLTGIVGGRPKVSPVVKLFSFLVPSNSVKAEIFMNGRHIQTYTPTSPTCEPPPASTTTTTPTSGSGVKAGTKSYRLCELAYLRSGDKGDTCNIGVICRDPKLYPYLEKNVTAESVGKYFARLFLDEKAQSRVKRYPLPGVSGFNFVLPQVLGGGGVSSHRFDPQGKSFAQMMCDMEIKDMPDIKNL